MKKRIIVALGSLMLAATGIGSSLPNSSYESVNNEVIGPKKQHMVAAQHVVPDVTTNLVTTVVTSNTTVTTTSMTSATETVSEIVLETEAPSQEEFGNIEVYNEVYQEAPEWVREETVNIVAEVEPSVLRFMPTHNDFLKEDIIWLAKLMDAEGLSAPMETRKRIGAVVLNRVDSALFPNTIPSVITQRNQYSTLARVRAMPEPSIAALLEAYELMEQFKSENWIEYCRALFITHKTVYQINGRPANSVDVFSEYNPVIGTTLSFYESVYDQSDYNIYRSISWSREEHKQSKAAESFMVEEYLRKLAEAAVTTTAITTTEITTSEVTTTDVTTSDVTVSVTTVPSNVGTSLESSSTLDSEISSIMSDISSETIEETIPINSENMLETTIVETKQDSDITTIE